MVLVTLKNGTTESRAGVEAIMSWLRWLASNNRAALYVLYRMTRDSDHNAADSFEELRELGLVPTEAQVIPLLEMLESNRLLDEDWGVPGTVRNVVMSAVIVNGPGDMRVEDPARKY